jgi:hypothetical protein
MNDDDNFSADLPALPTIVGTIALTVVLIASIVLCFGTP